MRRTRAVLLDIDGVLTVSWRPVPGAAEAVRALRDGGFALALVTNTTSRTRSWMAATLCDTGFAVSEDDIFTAPVITAAYLASNHPGAKCALLNSGDIGADLAGVTLVRDGPETPDVVILGGAGPEFSYQALNQVFGHLQAGARLVAMGRNLYWRTDEGLQLDGGAFLAGLEQASGVQAEVTGKPAAAFFGTALRALGADAAEAVMVGDDIEADVLGAQRAGRAARRAHRRPGQDRQVPAGRARQRDRCARPCHRFHRRPARFARPRLTPARYATARR